MPIQVSIGVSTEKNTLDAVKEAVTAARLKMAQESIDLAILFSSVEFAQANILKTIASLLELAPLVGSSNIAVISNQGIIKHGLIILLVSFPPGAYFNAACVSELTRKSARNAGEELGEKLLYGLKDIRRNLGLVLSDGPIQDIPALISGLQTKLGISFPFFGASTSDNLSFTKTNLYFNQELTYNAACGLILGGKINFGLGIKHGWKPLGKSRYVTKAEGNIVYEIDGLAAASVYEEYFAKPITELRKELRRISILYPIGIYLKGEEEYLLRNILAIENNGSLVFQGNVPEASEIRLMIGTKEACLAATRCAAEEVKKSLAGQKINFVLVFDSISRYILLGRQAHKELDILKQTLGEETPIIGIYTYGEEAPLKAINYLGKTYFHNQTIAVLGIAG